MLVYVKWGLLGLALAGAAYGGWAWRDRAALKELDAAREASTKMADELELERAKKAEVRYAERVKGAREAARGDECMRARMPDGVRGLYHKAPEYRD